MKQFTTILPGVPPQALLRRGTPESFLFLDIETTGLRPDHSFIYLIGCLSFSHEGDLAIHQWLSRGLREEEALLELFFAKAQKHKTLVTFHGDHFDLPYLMAAARDYYLLHPLDSLESLDLHRVLRPYQKILGLEKTSLSYLEHFLGKTRSQNLSGKERIRLYETYQAFGQEELLEPLLLHNREDLLGALHILSLLDYTDFLQEKFQFQSMEKKEEEWIITYSSPLSLPKPMKLPLPLEVWLQNNLLKLTIPLIQGELKYFFENHRDYIYLILEDYAVHKSIGQFVQAPYRKKATKSTAYQRVQGTFFPVFSNSWGKIYKKEYASQECFSGSALFLKNQRAAAQSYLQEFFHHCQIPGY